MSHSKDTKASIKRIASADQYRREVKNGTRNH